MPGTAARPYRSVKQTIARQRKRPRRKGAMPGRPGTNGNEPAGKSGSGRVLGDQPFELSHLGRRARLRTALWLGNVLRRYSRSEKLARAGDAQMEYPHWLIVAGAVLVVIGFIGLAFRRNTDVETNHGPTEMEENLKRDGRDSNATTLPAWPWRPPQGDQQRRSAGGQMPSL